jgi:formate-dependent nitrite reductase cytochrome c552 subunit
MPSNAIPMPKRETWRQCSFHNIAYRANDGCGMCKKQVEKSLHQHVIDIRKMLEDGMVNKEPLTKINAQLTEDIGEIQKSLKKLCENRSEYSCNVLEILIKMTEDMQKLMQTKMQLSGLLL